LFIQKKISTKLFSTQELKLFRKFYLSLENFCAYCVNIPFALLPLSIEFCRIEGFLGVNNRQESCSSRLFEIFHRLEVSSLSIELSTQQNVKEDFLEMVKCCTTHFSPTRFSQRFPLSCLVLKKIRNQTKIPEEDLFSKVFFLHLYLLSTLSLEERAFKLELIVEESKEMFSEFWNQIYYSMSSIMEEFQQFDLEKICDKAILLYFCDSFSGRSFTKLFSIIKELGEENVTTKDFGLSLEVSTQLNVIWQSISQGENLFPIKKKTSFLPVYYWQCADPLSNFDIDNVTRKH